LRDETKFDALSLLILRTNFSLKEVCDITGKDWCVRCWIRSDGFPVNLKHFHCAPVFLSHSVYRKEQVRVE